MTNQDEERFGIALMGLAEVFGEALSTPRMNAYREALKDLTIEQFEEAASRLIGASKFFPKPVEFRDVLIGTQQDQAEQAWRTFVELCQFEGSYPSLRVTDGAMAFAIEHLGGWVGAQVKLNVASPEMAASYAKEFKASYRLGLARQSAEKYFRGELEISNRGGNFLRLQGQTIPLPVCLVSTEKYQSFRLPFDFTRGQLTDEARGALQAGGYALMPFAPKVAPALPSAVDDEMATPEEVAQLKSSIASLTDGKVVSINARKSS